DEQKTVVCLPSSFILHPSSFQKRRPVVLHTNPSGATRWGLNALLLMSLCLILHWGETILVPTVLALLGTALLWPCVNWLHRRVPIPGLSFQAFFPCARPCLGWSRVPWGIACTVTSPVAVR